MGLFFQRRQTNVRSVKKLHKSESVELDCDRFQARRRNKDNEWDYSGVHERKFVLSRHENFIYAPRISAKTAKLIPQTVNHSKLAK